MGLSGWFHRRSGSLKTRDSGGGLGEPAHNTRLSLAQVLLLALELGLLVFVIRQFQIESSAFLRVVLLALVGFVVHSFLALRYRLLFFLALSLTGIGVVFGVTNGAWLVGTGLVLIMVCHLPVPFPVRVALLLVTGSLLAVLRLGWL